MTKKREQKSGLSTTSLVLSITGITLALTIIGAFVGVPLAILGLIFGIIALVKKQRKGTAMAGVIIGGIVTLITIVIAIFLTIFLRNNSDIIVTPIMEISDMMENDPALAEMMNNPTIQAEFETIFTARISEKLGDNENLETWEEIKPQIPVIFDEMKSVMLELKEKNSVK